MDALVVLFATTSVLAAMVMVAAAARGALRVRRSSRVRWWTMAAGLATGVLPGGVTLNEAVGGRPTGDHLWLVVALTVVFSAVANGLWRLLPAVAEFGQARQALQSRDQMLDASEEISGTGYWEWDRTTRILTRSEEAVHILGTPAVETDFDLAALVRHVAPQDRERVRTTFELTSTEGFDLRYNCTEFAESVLRRAGYDVVCTTTSDEALIELFHRSYDLLLLDVNMPAPNGWQVLHEALTLNPQQCILMFSGFALEEEAKERGAAGLIQKPFSGPTLIEKVTGTLRNGSATPEPAVEV